jgi:trehalose 6-phosphate phosphatase
MPQAQPARTSDPALKAPPRLAPRTIALFADLDGTLAPLATTPSQVGPDPARRLFLNQLMVALEWRFAVISGRALADVDRILEGEVTAVAAIHGLVRRTAGGEVRRIDGDGRLGEALAALRAFASRRPGLLVEDKGLAAALHFRLEPEARKPCGELARGLADQHGLIVQDGDMVVELRVPGADKGAAVAAFMAEPPFKGFTPWFIGDDLTDEDGFSAVLALGGHGVIVGRRRPTLASFALRGPEAVRAWLRGAIEAGA